MATWVANYLKNDWHATFCHFGMPAEGLNYDEWLDHIEKLDHAEELDHVEKLDHAEELNHVMTQVRRMMVDLRRIVGWLV